MKAHIGTDTKSGLVHKVVGTTASADDIMHVDRLLYGEENVVCADAGYTGGEAPQASKPRRHLADRDPAQHLQETEQAKHSIQG